MPARVTCELCGVAVPPQGHYIVRIDVFADPSMPEMSSADLEEANFDEVFAKLIDEMKHMTADDLQDQVHRQFEYRLCPSCQRKFLANPMGKPREMRPGTN